MKCKTRNSFFAIWMWFQIGLCGSYGYSLNCCFQPMRRMHSDPWKKISETSGRMAPSSPSPENPLPNRCQNWPRNRFWVSTMSLMSLLKLETGLGANFVSVWYWVGFGAGSLCNRFGSSGGRPGEVEVGATLVPKLSQIDTKATPTPNRFQADTKLDSNQHFTSVNGCVTRYTRKRFFQRIQIRPGDSSRASSTSEARHNGWVAANASVQILMPVRMVLSNTVAVLCVTRFMAPSEVMGLTWVWFSQTDPMQGPSAGRAANIYEIKVLGWGDGILKCRLSSHTRCHQF